MDFRRHVLAECAASLGAPFRRIGCGNAYEEVPGQIRKRIYTAAVKTHKRFAMAQLGIDRVAVPGGISIAADHKSTITDTFCNLFACGGARLKDLVDGSTLIESYAVAMVKRADAGLCRDTGTRDLTIELHTQIIRIRRNQCLPWVKSCS